MTDYILIYSLIDCPYSESACKLLETNNIRHKVIKVHQNNKEKYKKENNMNTFPQIFHINNIQKTKIGGYDDIKKFIELKNKINKNIDQYDKLINIGIPNIDKKLVINVLLLTF